MRRKPHKQTTEQDPAKEAARLLTRALNGDLGAIVTVLKMLGELPEDYTAGE